MERTNQQWLDDLRGTTGSLCQETAHKELANILYRRIYNYLRLRQNNLYSIHAFADEEVAALACDFAQETMAKLSANQFALLDTYRGEGEFVNWATKVALRVAGEELRRPYWQRRDEEPEDSADPEQAAPEYLAQMAHIQSMIEDCLARLPERQRIAFVECIVNDKSAIEVGKALNCNPIAVNQLVYRAKNSLRTCLENKGFGRDSFGMFK